MLLFQFIFFTFIPKIKSICELQEDCSINDTCSPKKADENHTNPKIINSSFSYICPEFENEKVCCSNRQLYKIIKIFELIDQTFGSLGQGCDICSMNIKNFWCNFICSPYQNDFLNIGKITNHTIDGKIRKLLDVNFTINQNISNQIFNSCKKTKFVSQFPSLDNSFNFFNYQSIKAYNKSDIYILMFHEQNSGLNFTVNKCNETINDGKNNYINFTSCSCSNCDLKCDYDINNNYNILYGFNSFTVIIVYGMVLFFSLCIFFLKKSRKNDDENDEFMDFQRNYN